MNIHDIKPYAKNAKKHPQKQVDAIAASIEEFGFNQPIVVDKGNVVIVGHGRLMAAKQLGLVEVPVVVVDATEEQAKAYRLADNKLNESPWEMDLVIDELRELSPPMLELTGFSALDIKRAEFNAVEHGNLVEEYVVPPFSVLDTRQGYWQDRKRKWVALFGDSREGRDDNLLGGFGQLISMKGDSKLTGTSEFDPVLAEVLYQWFSPAGGSVLDPFAGGVVRGAVASKLGRVYTGIDLSHEQCVTNAQMVTAAGLTATYIVGDSNEVLDQLDGEYDFVMSCPPYYDLEHYSEDPQDLSNLGSYDDFVAMYRSIIQKACGKLRDGGFAAFTVGSIRDSSGAIHDLTGDTVRAFESAGLMFYNDIVLLNANGTAALRVGNTFKRRKVVKTHQNVLVFYKGDPKKIPPFEGVFDGFTSEESPEQTQA